MSRGERETEPRSGSDPSRRGDLDPSRDLADELSDRDREGDLDLDRVPDRDLDLDRELDGERL